MDYLLIIGIGYVFNIVMLIIYAANILSSGINLSKVNSAKQILSIKTQYLIDRGINPFMSIDFILLLPYGHGLYILYIIPNLFNNLYSIIKHKEEHLDKLIKEYNDNNTKDKK